MAEEGASSDEVDARRQADFIQRLTYEYKEKQKRYDELRDLLCNTDQLTGRPLFKPVVPMDAELRAALESAENANPKLPIHDRLLQAGKLHNERLVKMQQESWERERQELADKAKYALPESEKILEESSIASIGEIFKVMLTCQMHKEVRNSSSPNGAAPESLSNEMIHKISSELTNWKDKILNIADADPDIMIDAVQSVIAEVMSLATETNCNQKYPDIYQQFPNALLLDFDTFAHLIRQCIRRREGGGKSYLFLPKRDVSPKKIEPEPTFKPTIDLNSQKIARAMRSGQCKFKQ